MMFNNLSSCSSHNSSSTTNNTTTPTNTHEPLLEYHQLQPGSSWCSTAQLASQFFQQQPSSSFHPSSFTSPSSFGASSLARMESTFCKNFVCCSIPLDDLHDLLEHYEQAHVHQSPAQNIANESNHHRPDLVVFEDEDEWSGTESASTTNHHHHSFDRSHSPPDHPTTATHSPPTPTTPPLPSLTPSLTPSSTKTKTKCRKTPLNHWSKIDDGFGIPPSLLDGRQSQPNRTDPQQELMMMIDMDEDGSSSIDSDRPLDPPHHPNHRPKPNPKRKLSPDQIDWQSNREKPYRCTIPGCEKAYKQPNGLKYHKTHGHCSQKTLSLEDESKTFVCHDPVCGKRYKNINGLRYHYQHTGPHGRAGLNLLSLGHHPSGPSSPSLNLTTTNNNNDHHPHRHPLLTSNSNLSTDIIDVSMDH